MEFKNIAYAIVKAVHANGGRFLVQSCVSPHDDTASPTTSMTTSARITNNHHKNYVFQEVSKAVAVSKAVQAIRHQAKNLVEPTGVRRGDEIHYARHRSGESMSLLPTVHHRATTTSPNGTGNINNNKSKTQSSLSSPTKTIELPSSGGFVPILPCLSGLNDTNIASTKTRKDHGQQLYTATDKQQQPQECANSVMVSPPLASHAVPTSLQEILLCLHPSSTLAAAPGATTDQKHDPLSTIALAASSLLLSTGLLHHQQPFPLPTPFQPDFHSSSPFLILDRLCDEIRVLRTVLLQSSSSTSSSMRGPEAMTTNSSTTTSMTPLSLSLLHPPSSSSTAMVEALHQCLAARDLFLLHQNNNNNNNKQQQW